MDLGDTDTSTSTRPSPALLTSVTLMHPPWARPIIGIIYGTDHGLPMSPALDPMTFDELSELYRVEMKSNAVTQARKDLFRAMAGLLTNLRQEYDRQMALDPESIMCEGAEQRRKSAERLVKDVMRLRTQKICGMALRGATGSKNTLDNLTDEEREYYAQVLEISKKHISEIDRLRGRRKTVETHIDEIPAPAPEPEPFSRDIIITVSMYENGSFEPLSISSRGERLFFRPSLFERSIENTDAASVELMTAPISMLSIKSHLNTKWQKSPVSMAVTTTPALASIPAGSAALLAVFLFLRLFGVVPVVASLLADHNGGESLLVIIIERFP